MARVKFDRDGEGGKEALGVGNLPIFLLSGISNTSLCKVHEVLD